MIRELVNILLGHLNLKLLLDFLIGKEFRQLHMRAMLFSIFHMAADVEAISILFEFGSPSRSRVGNARRVRVATLLHLHSGGRAAVVDCAKAHATATAVLRIHERTPVFVHIHVDLVDLLHLLDLLCALAFHRALQMRSRQRFYGSLCMGRLWLPCATDRSEVSIDFI